MSDTRRGFFGKVAAALVATKVAPVIPRETFAPNSTVDLLPANPHGTFTWYGVSGYVITTGAVSGPTEDHSAPSKGTPRDEWVKRG
jgi:hypothetical protein